MAQERDIKYINREFSDFRQDLVELAKNYFPDTYNDFSATSPGMMFIEMASYVGDVLSFYQDTQLQETFLQHAQNPQNLYTLAYMMGYRPRVTSASTAEITVTQEIASTGSAYTPNWNQAIRIAENSTIKSTTSDNTVFVLDNAIDFKFSSSYDPTTVTIDELNEGDNTPATYLLKKKVKATSGEIQTVDFTIGTSEKYKTLEIQDESIIRILDITDADGNEWYEVPFLAQDTIFKEEENINSDSALAPRNLILQKIPRRFVSRFTSTGILQLQFGAGVTEADDEEFLPNPENLVPGKQDQVEKLDIAYDPSNFLFSRTYGLAPSNTTLTVRYLKGGGVASNSPAGSITEADVVTTSATDDSQVTTLSFTNINPAQGGKDGDTIEELRQNALKSYGEQKRAVTLDDYTVRALSMPPQFGSIAKVFATQDPLLGNKQSILEKNPLAIALFIVAYDNEGKLTTASQTLKNNLKKYLSQYMMITDAIDIKDAFIVNIKVKFEVVTLPNKSAREVLSNCTLKLQEYFKTANMNINVPINLSAAYASLDQVNGVQTVKSIVVENRQGGNYSEFAYDIKGATKDNIVYPSYDPSIFEVKYPNIDIEGRVTTL